MFINTKLKKLINIIENFPNNGEVFKDITPLLNDHWNTLIDEFDKLINFIPDYFIGINDTGVLFAGALAYKYKKGLAIIKKEGQLPPLACSIEYALEDDEISKLEIIECTTPTPFNTIIIINDIYATGRTLNATERLCTRAGYKVIDKLVLINLKYLHQPDESVKSIIEYKKANEI